MAKPIFVSYRHINEGNVAHVISRMTSSLGKEPIFFDQTEIRGGDLWEVRLREVAQARVVVAFIGQGWEGSFHQETHNGDPDYVLQELKTALGQQITIIPVLIGRHDPEEVEFAKIPVELRPLKGFQFVRIFHRGDYERDSAEIDKLIDQLCVMAGVTKLGHAKFPIEFNSLVKRDQLEVEHLLDIEKRVWDWFSSPPGADQPPACVAVWGLPGIGKSTLANLVAIDPRVKQTFPDGVLFGRLGKDAKDEQALTVFREWANKLKIPEEQRKTFNTADDWRKALQATLTDRKVLVVIDDVWSHELGETLLLDGHCAHFFTTRQQSIANELAGEKVLRLPKLGEDQSLRLLKRRAPNAFFEGTDGLKILDHIKRIAREVDGLPLALVLIGSSLKQVGTEDGPEEIDSQLNYLDSVEHRLTLIVSGQGEQTLAAVIESSYDALLSRGSEGTALQGVLRRLCALRPDPKRFSGALAKKVTDANNHTIDTLKRFGLVERVQDPRGKTSGKEKFYTIHRTITECIRRKLSHDEAHQVFESAVAYYENSMQELEEEFQSSASQWSSQFRYESTAWQHAMESWRYYLTRLGRYDEIALKVMKMWFGGYWWWGCFSDFQYCDQLIADWSVEGDDKSTAELDLANLNGFRTAYPKETEERMEGKLENWLTARQNLEEIGKRRHLDGDVNTFDEDQCDLRGLLSVFIAETYRFGDRNHAAAEEFYRDATYLFDRPFLEHPDYWNQPWARYHLADFLCESGRLDEAEAFAEEAFEMSADGRELDPEVRAVLSRVRGDIAVARNNVAGAVENYHRAVFYAYRYQVKPVAPDAYTVRFYPLVVSRVVKSVLRLHGTNPESSLKVALGLEGIWRNVHTSVEDIQRALDTGNAEALERDLFPPALSHIRLLDSDHVRGIYVSEVEGNIASLATSRFGDEDTMQRMVVR